MGKINSCCFHICFHIFSDVYDNSISAQRADKSKELAIEVDEGQGNFAQIMQDQYYEQAIEESRQAFDVSTSRRHFWLHITQLPA